MVSISTEEEIVININEIEEKIRKINNIKLQFFREIVNVDMTCSKIENYMADGDFTDLLENFTKSTRKYLMLCLAYYEEQVIIAKKVSETYKSVDEESFVNTGGK